ncbi:MAG: hypothetical protein CMJ18_27450 [Phycisphaeraceae bacterium]|nr:hypothetical protein [Phycisphaeraceae bacterium]
MAALFGGTAHATLVFNDGAVNTLDFNAGMDVIVRNSPSGDPTTLLVVDGAKTGASGDMGVRGASILVMPGGEISDGFDTYGTSMVTINDGLLRNLQAHGSSTASMNGGFLSGNLLALDNAMVSLNGGSVDNLLTEGANSRAVWRGGEVRLFVRSIVDGEITIIGDDFAVDGSFVPFGPIAATEGTLSGALANGSQISQAFTRFFPNEPDTIGQIILVEVPEPASVTILSVGAVAMWRWRSGRRRA